MEEGQVRVTGSHLRVVHAALIAGVGVFALVFSAVGTWEAARSATVLRFVWFGTASVAVLTAGIVSGKLAAETDDMRRARAAIVIWSLGEGPALLGLVLYFVSGDRLLLMVPLITFLMFMTRYRPSSFAARAR